MRSLILIIVICTLFPKFLFSQYYSFSVSSGTYTQLENGVSINNGYVWNILEGGFPIGFDFPYFDSEVDSLYFFQDGSSSTLSSSNQEGGIHQLFMPFGAAVVDRGYGTSVSQSPVSYKVSGLPGNRIFKIEWKNAGLYGEFQFHGTTSDYINFQMWLYELTGNIEIHYGPSLFNYPQFDFTFESGPVVSFVPSYDWDQDLFSPNSLWLIGNPASPDMIASEEINFLGGTMEPGTIFNFHNLLVNEVKNGPDATSVYPNPVVDRLTLRLSGNNSRLTIIINDMTGRKVYNSTILNQQGEIVISVSDLNPGIFQLSVIDGIKTYNTRFIKL